MVTFTEITVEDGVLTLRWDKNLHHHGAKNEDLVKIFAYSEDLGLTQCVATAERRTRRLSTLLPDAFRNAHLWALIEDPQGRTSDSQYLETLTPSNPFSPFSPSSPFGPSIDSIPSANTNPAEASLQREPSAGHRKEPGALP